MCVVPTYIEHHRFLLCRPLHIYRYIVYSTCVLYTSLELSEAKKGRKSHPYKNVCRVFVYFETVSCTTHVSSFLSLFTLIAFRLFPIYIQTKTRIEGKNVGKFSYFRIDQKNIFFFLLYFFFCFLLYYYYYCYDDDDGWWWGCWWL